MSDTDGDLAQLAREAIAARAVLALAPHQAQTIVRLPTEARREVYGVSLDHLVSVGLLTGQQADGMRSGEPPTTDAPVDMMTTSVYSLLASATRAPPMTDSIVDDLWVLAVTAWGAIVGEGIAGPVGGGIGAMLAHDWAQEHPPSTWFE
jgi:hypothetical protein